MHRAWIVAASAFVALLAAAAIRATFGILMEPLMDEFGWSHGAIATAASVNLVVFGISAPFAAALNERFGLRRVVTVALTLIVVAAALLTQVTQLWQLYVVWGLVAGAATGAVAPVLAATVAGRWFTQRRGLVVGLLTAANSTGQLVFLPLMAHLVTHGDWRATMIVVGGAAVLALVAVRAGLRDSPEDVGTVPYGGLAEPIEAGAPAGGPRPGGGGGAPPGAWPGRSGRARGRRRSPCCARSIATGSSSPWRARSSSAARPPSASPPCISSPPRTTTGSPRARPRA